MMKQIKFYLVKYKQASAIFLKSERRRRSQLKYNYYVKQFKPFD